MLTSTDPVESVQHAPNLATTQAVWGRRLMFLRIVLITVLLIGILFWLLSFVINPILILIVAALLAYAIVPVIDLLHRVMPRALAIVLIYILVIVVAGGLAYLTVKTLIPQFSALANSVTTYVTPGSNGQDSPLVQMLKGIGFTQNQINAASKQLQSQLGTFASNVAKDSEQLITATISVGFNILITAVVSVYLLIDGYRFGSWVIKSSPASQQGWISTVLALLQRVVGGYIRGQIILSAIIGVLQGVGMAIIGVPFAPLIGVLAFFLEFIPMIGTIVTGFIAVVIALTQSWQLAIITLAYTILIDMLEGYVLSPRILAKAVEIRPVVTLLAMIAGSQVFGIWGAVFAAPTAGLVQALVGAFWQYYEKTHVQEFPLQNAEQAANPQEASPLVVTDPVNEPSV